MKISVPNVVLLLLMLLSAGMASALRPTISLADERTPISLKTMVPTAFGDWQEQRNVSAAIVDPTQTALLDKIYSETLTRTYVNKVGYRVMLSIAYGKNQSDALQLHKPEICYPAQGFVLLAKEAGTLDLLGKPIAAVRLQTKLGVRVEPITYWTVVGDHITKSGIDKKLTEMRYALTGRIPDGMLVRVSSIDTGTDNAYAMQGQFANQMVQAIAPDLRNRFAGDPALN
jgi:EpsI family protein